MNKSKVYYIEDKVDFQKCNSTGRANIDCVKSVRICSFSGPYFLIFGLNTERYPNLCVFSTNVG